MFWQLTAAIRNTLMFGLLVTLICRIIAIAVGLISGYAGGRTDQIMMAINDTLGALPNIPILLLIYFVMRDQMTWPLLAVVAALLGWNYDCAPDPLGRAQPRDPRVHPPRGLCRHAHAADPARASTCPTSCRSSSSRP